MTNISLEALQEELKNLPKLLKKQERELKNKIKEAQNDLVDIKLKPIKENIKLKRKELKALEVQLNNEKKKLGLVSKNKKRKNINITKDELIKLVKSGIDTFKGLSEKLKTSPITLNKHIHKLGLKVKKLGKGRSSKISLA